MRWEGQRESDNVEDRRGMGPARVGGGVGGLGLGGIVLVLAVSYFTGINPLTLINMLSGVQSLPESSIPSEPAPTGSPDDKLGKFASVVLADTETTWKQLLGPRYEDPRLVLFTGGVQSACGTTSSAVGPFYCPMDHKVYLDLSFFNEMSHRLGAPGDFAQAYVIAMRWAITYRISWALQKRSRASSGKPLNEKGMPYRCEWNCKPIVSPASGATMPSVNGT